MTLLLIGNHKGVFPAEITKKLRGHGWCVLHVDFVSLAIDTGTGQDHTYADRLNRAPLPGKLKTPVRLYLLAQMLASSDADIIHFHYSRWFYFLLYPRIKRLRTPVISTIYGSDYYRISPFKRLLQRLFFRSLDALSFTNESTQQALTKDDPSLRGKSYLTRFGLSPLSDIDQYRDVDKTTIRDALQFPIFPVTIACGYNANPGQQHLKIIHELSKLPKEYKEDTLFLFPLTYGGSATYVNAVKRALAGSNLNWAVLETFLTGPDNAYVRLLPDVMLNLQVTDQFSGSMQEHLYAGNVVITGSWLPYETFEQKGVVFERINSFEALAPLLAKILSELPAYKDRLSANIRIIHQLSDWENTLTAWEKMYHDVTTEKRL